jgi:hypothetical protein
MALANSGTWILSTNSQIDYLIAENPDPYGEGGAKW